MCNANCVWYLSSAKTSNDVTFPNIKVCTFCTWIILVYFRIPMIFNQNIDIQRHLVSNFARKEYQIDKILHYLVLRNLCNGKWFLHVLIESKMTYSNFWFEPLFTRCFPSLKQRFHENLRWDLNARPSREGVLIPRTLLKI